MRRILYLCDWLPPDFGAVGQYGLQFARELAAQGNNVALAGLSSTESSVESEQVGDGKLSVVRMFSGPCDRARLARRMMWTLRTNFKLLWHVRKSMRQCDEIIFTGSPAYILHFVGLANLFLRKRLVYRITDFHPECLMADVDKVPYLLRLVHKLTLFWRRRVHTLEVISEDQKRRLLEMGFPEEQIRIKRDRSPVDFSDHPEPLPRPDALKDGEILLYSGNFGVAHDHETFIEGYRRHHVEGSGTVKLWLNATGAKADRVEEAIRAAGLPVHRTQPVPIEQLARLMVTPDAHLITLRDPFVGYVMPSKVYACIDSGRSVLYVGSDQSDIDLLCKERIKEATYRHVPVGEPQQVCDALEAIGSTH